MGSPFWIAIPTKLLWALETKPETFTFIRWTRTSSIATFPTVRHPAATWPRSTGAVVRPMSCCREGSMSTVASPSTGGAAPTSSE